MGVVKKTKGKVEDLKRQLKHIKGTDLLGSVNFNTSTSTRIYNSSLNSNVLTLLYMTKKLSICLS